MFSLEHDPRAAQDAANLRWAARLDRWSRRLHLHGLLTALLDAAEPLGPLGAQVIWIAQPVLGLFVPRPEIDALARLLDAPGGMAWLNAQLEAGTEARAPVDGSRDGTGDERL